MDEANDALNQETAAAVITDHKELRQFEMRYLNHLLYVEYEIREGKLFLTHTNIPRELEDDAARELLIEQVLLHIESSTEMKVVPWSKAVANYIRKKTEWKRILSTGIRL
ncbi:MAG: N-acetyltransferase [Flavobacteriales bacterium]|nr:N-acetyltransferase [Flavobacteriales bacterium]